jgi:glycosyltransferase involved in cell wall biosynthesis
MTLKKPKVSIGMPVYNGENFLHESLKSLLSQSFRDFELIISDNASTDDTESICRYYQAQDSRIKYSRNQENLGASRNYNKVFSLASGEYFKWAAHDDICHPDFLEKCVRVLDNDPSIVLAYTECNRIDENGEEIYKWVNLPQDFSSPFASQRAEEVITKNSWVLIFGLIRSEILSMTPLLGNFNMHDWILVFELALHGKFYKVPELLFSFRKHPSQFTENIWKYNQFMNNEVIKWFDPSKGSSLTFPFCRRTYEHLVSCQRVPLSPKERFICSTIVAKWMWTWMLIEPTNKIASKMKGVSGLRRAKI